MIVARGAIGCAVLVFVLGLAAQAHGGPRSEGGSPAAVDIERILSAMSLDEQVGQVIFGTATGTRVGAHTRRWLARVRPGALLLFQYNLRTPAQIRRITRDLHAVLPIPPLLAVDHEGGPIARFPRGVPRRPGARALGRLRDPGRARATGRTMGRALAALGFDMNLAPVLDLPRGRGYLVARAFSSDPEITSRLGAAYIRGLREAGILSVAKHFPGQGLARGDTHRTLPRIRASLERLRARDLVPFASAIDAGVDGILTSHARFEEADPRRQPASFSSFWLTDVARRGLKFEGLIITDGLEMRAIRDRHSVGDAAVMAFQAGADLVSVFWSPRKIAQAKRALLAAVRSGRISRERLAQSVRGILRAKVRRGLLRRPDVAVGARPHARATEP